MLKNIQRMRGYGVFGDYTKPTAIKDFSDRNVIYGWNYSGKTTISRLFSMLEWKKLHDNFPDTKFQVTDHGGASITDESVASCTKVIRVFNHDFIENNLKWDGQSFNPVLLLGDDSIETERRIDFYEKLIKRCDGSISRKRKAVAEIEATLAEAKTSEAKKIKHTLGVVDAFTASHLSSILLSQGFDDTKYTLSLEQLASDLKLASTAEKDKLASVPKVVVSLMAATLYSQASTLLSKTPTFSRTIEYLKENPEVSDWVGEGLHLHEGETNCKFCGNAITATRLAELHAHFSQDVINHKSNLKNLIQQGAAAKLAKIDIRSNEFNAQFRDRLKPILLQLETAVIAYNGWLVDLISMANAKLRSQFVSLVGLSDPISLQDAVTEVLLTLNMLIEDNNQISENFTSEKIKALIRLKNHYVEQFQIDYKIKEREERKRELKAHDERYKRAAAQAQVKIAQLLAASNPAQKGREKINDRIANLLGTNSIEISVIEVGGNERFQLIRQGRIARNLSEGEKTAIAFAFFLTKLQEIQNLDDVIVYIDDPISSFDSNHIFQMFSIIKNTFFYKDSNAKREWKTTCKQIFISTHNFEFFSLLRELPGGDKKMRYYLTKRVSAAHATFTDMPLSILKYSSEYHYLFSVMYDYHQGADKSNIEQLLSLPNAVRRFVELYTYSKIPLPFKSTVDQRAEQLFGAEKSQRLLKVLHHFSHLNSIERLASNTDLISDIETSINEIMEHIKTTDKMHYDALVAAVI